MNTIGNAASGISMISAQSLASMDIETALLTVQNQRTQLIDEQLKTQINEVNLRNQMTARLNDMQAKLNGLKAALKSDAKPHHTVPDTSENQQLARDYAMIALSSGMSTDPVGVKNIKYNSDGSIKSFELATKSVKDGYKVWPFVPKYKDVWDPPSKEGIEKSLTQIKSRLDSESNTQQMDMLRLQQLSNKRNESFDIMTNFIKKMQDNRSAIIGNLR